METAAVTPAPATEGAPATGRRHRAARSRSLAAIFCGALVLVSCGANSTKNQYVLAEKLWSDQKYAAAVTEFDKIAARDPQGKLGLQALYRSATTQALFLSQYADAVRKFRAYAQLSGDTPQAWEAQTEIGDLLFSKLEQYEPAIQQYRAMLAKKPQSPQAPEFKFRIAKAEFYLWRFADAVTEYREIVRDHPNTDWAERASFEIGQTYYTQGEQQQGGGGLASGTGTGAKETSHKGGTAKNAAAPPGAYQQAIDAFQEFIQVYPKSARIPEARFGIASCLEEMDQLDAAYAAYEKLLKTYPSPKVVQIKLVRIRERKAQRSH